MRALTSKEERQIVMRPLRQVSKREKIIFPIMVTVFVALLVPSAGPLIACLMLGNLFKESGVVERLNKTAQNELMNIVTIFLGISVGATATATETRSFASVEIASTGVATVKFKNLNASGNGVRNWLRFNSSNSPMMFSCYSSGQTDVYLYKEVTAVAEVEKPVFSVNSGDFTEAFGVTISCETEGAEIRYTTDGTEPDASSTLYTAGSEITVSATTTLKAIALKGDASSAVATAVYTFPVKYTSMAALLEGVEMPANNKTSDAFVVGFDAIVTYVNGGNVYFVQNGTPGLIFKYDTGYVPGDVIKAGWIGHLKNYNGLPELEPESAMTSEGTADVPEPLAFTGMDGAALNSIVKVEGVTFAEATPGTDATGQARNFTGTWGDDESELAFYNQFKIAAVEAGKYTVLAVVGCYNTTMQLQPISYEEYVEPVEPATTVYYVLPLKDMDVADNNEESAFIPHHILPLVSVLRRSRERTAFRQPPQGQRLHLHRRCQYRP